MTEAAVRRVAAASILPLRAAVLRPGRPPAAAAFAEDAAATTIHLAALDPDGRVVGCATVFPAPYPGRPPLPGPAWRLRGMATTPEVRGAGYGRRLLEAAEAAAAAEGAALLWCQARVSADRFYDAAGLRADGPEFAVPEIGAHRLRWVALGAPAPGCAGNVEGRGGPGRPG